VYFILSVIFGFVFVKRCFLYFLFVIFFVLKVVQVGGNLKRFRQKQLCTVFLRHGVVLRDEEQCGLSFWRLQYLIF